MASTMLGFINRPPIKRRRTATSVLAGDFDFDPRPTPTRDVLTSLLNGVGPYERVEGTEEQRKIWKEERRKNDKLKEKEKKARTQRKQNGRKGSSAVETTPRASTAGVAAARSKPQQSSRGSSIPSNVEPSVNKSTASFWDIRGPAIVATRSVSPSPPPELDSPPTPGPSISSTISYGSSKRPHTPDDGELPAVPEFRTPTPVPFPKPPKKKRAPARKGWKGWVEGSPPPSDKLINLDDAPILVERRTRSGKNFDAISEGKEGWVNPDASSSTASRRK